MIADPEKVKSGPDVVGDGPEVYRLAQSFCESAARALVEGALHTSVRAIQRNEVAGSHAVFFAETTTQGECVLRVATHPEHDLALELWAEARGRKAGVPVPKVLASVTEPSEGMLPFVIAQRASGAAAHSEELSVAERTAIFRQLGIYAARIHRMPICGFGALRPDGNDGYSGGDDSLAAWAERDLAESLEMLAALPEPPVTSANVEAIRALFAASRSALDLPVAVLAHGDFRLKNVLVTGAQVTAVLDFEMALAGDPALDLAWLLHSDCQTEANQEALFRGYETEAPEALGENFPLRLTWYRLRYALIELWWAASFGDADPALERVEDSMQALRSKLHRP